MTRKKWAKIGGYGMRVKNVFNVADMNTVAQAGHVPLRTQVI